MYELQVEGALTMMQEIELYSQQACFDISTYAVITLLFCDA